MLLSAAMCLYCKSDSSGGGGRFAKIGELLDSLIDRWPALIEQSHRFVETLIDGLPNSESRWLWRLQVKLRGGKMILTRGIVNLTSCWQSYRMPSR